MAVRHMLRLCGMLSAQPAQIPTRAAAAGALSAAYAAIAIACRVRACDWARAGLQRADLLVARGQAALQRLDLAPQHGDAGRVAADLHEGRRRRHADLDAAVHGHCRSGLDRCAWAVMPPCRYM